MKEHTISEQVSFPPTDRSNFVFTKIGNRRCKVIILVRMCVILFHHLEVPITLNLSII